MKRREGKRSSQPNDVSEEDKISNIEESSSNEDQFSSSHRDPENEGDSEEDRSRAREREKLRIMEQRLELIIDMLLTLMSNERAIAGVSREITERDVEDKKETIIPLVKAILMKECELKAKLIGGVVEEAAIDSRVRDIDSHLMEYISEVRKLIEHLLRGGSLLKKTDRGVDLGNNDIEKVVKAILAKDSELKAQLIDKVVEKAVIDSDVLEDIAEEIADVLEDDPTFSRALVTKVLTTEDTKDLIVTKLIEEME